MTTVVATIDGGATVQEAAKLMLERRIKRVPVLEAGRLVGIVRRADLVRRRAITPARTAPRASSDRALRRQVLKEVAQTGAVTVYVNITVEGGAVHLCSLRMRWTHDAHSEPELTASLEA